MRPAAVLGITVLAGACYAGVGDYEPTAGLDEPNRRPQEPESETDTPEALCGVAEPGPAPLRRLTRTEYNNTVYDLLGDDSRPADAFVGEDIILGFDNNADGATMSRLLAEQYETAANALSARATADLDELMSCDPVADEDGCVREFLTEFTTKAFRRPLTDTEVDRYFDFFSAHREEEDLAKSLELTISAILQSPNFLYRVETGDLSRAADGVVPLTGYEIATRLSYLLWNSLPDDALFEAAANGELDTAAQIAAQAERMLEDPRAEAVVLDFHEQWLALRDHVPTELEDMEPLLREETQTFLSEVVLSGDGTLGTLLRADFSYMNAELAEFYGMDSTDLGDEFERVSLDPQQRSGLITQALPMAINAEEHETSPIKRGRFVRELLLCQPLPPPPPNVDVEPPDPDPNKTTRERYAEHRENPQCAACHNLIDPLGFAFEHYDQFGQWREQENGRPVDASGELGFTDEEHLHGELYGAVELAQRLAESETVEACAVDGWFRYAYGRDITEADSCTIEHLRDTFVESDGNIRELLFNLTQTDAFRFRPAH